MSENFVTFLVYVHVIRYVCHITRVHTLSTSNIVSSNDAMLHFWISLSLHLLKVILGELGIEDFLSDAYCCICFSCCCFRRTAGAGLPGISLCLSVNETP